MNTRELAEEGARVGSGLGGQQDPSGAPGAGTRKICRSRRKGGVAGLSGWKCWDALYHSSVGWCLCDCRHPAAALTHSHTTHQQQCCGDLGVHQRESVLSAPSINLCKPKGISCCQVVKLPGLVSWWLRESGARASREGAAMLWEPLGS